MKPSEKKIQLAVAFCDAAVKQLVQAAAAAGMEVQWPDPKRFGLPQVYLDGVPVRTLWKRTFVSFRARLVVGSAGEGRSYPIRDDGSFNEKAILARVREVLKLREASERAYAESERREQQDKQLYERLKPLHRNLGRIRIECEFGRTEVSVAHLDEDEAKRVLAALAEVLRPKPTVGEIWQHKKVQMPSRITSVKGTMIHLEGLKNHQTCAIPRREFVDGWELISSGDADHG